MITHPKEAVTRSRPQVGLIRRLLVKSWRRRPGAEAEARNQADSLIHSTERQLAEHGDKVTPEVKTEIETAIAEAKAAVESGDAAAMTEKTNALTQAAMKLGQAMYEQQQQAQAQPEGGEAADATAEAKPAEEEVVDAEFSEVDDEQKG